MYIIDHLLEPYLSDIDADTVDLIFPDEHEPLLRLRLRKNDGEDELIM